MSVDAERTFEEVVAARYESLRRSAYLLCGDRQYAEDIVQIVFLRLHRQWGRRGEIADLDAYLHVVLVNVARTWWRRRWRREMPSSRLPEPQTPDPTGFTDLRHSLAQALATISPDHREVLVLRFLSDLSEAETARALNCSVGTVKSRTSRAISSLRASGLLDDSVETK